MARDNGTVDDHSVTNDTADNEPGFPSAEALDYAEIILLSIMVVVGGPMNIVSFCQTLSLCPNNSCFPKFAKHFNLRQKSEDRKSTAKNHKHNTRTKSSNVSNRTARLKLHLIAANLFIILIYGVSQISWLITYSWRGGDILCRVIKFFDTFCFYATSNIVVLIAIERVSVAIFIDQPRIVAKHKQKLQLAIWTPWILAVLCSLPQFYIWHVFAPYPDQLPDWQQCITIWMAWRVRTESNSSETATISFQETLYSGLHLVSVFWLPATIVVLAYGIILVRFHQHIRKSTKEARRNQWAVNAAQFRQRAVSFHRSTTGGLSPSPPPSSCGGAATDGDSTALSVQHLETYRCNGAQHSQSQLSVLDIGDRSRSAAILTEVATVVSSSRILVFQPKLKTVAVKTLARAKRRTVRTTAWILFAYIACWTPYNTLELWRYLDPTVDNRYLELLSNLIVLNAVLNPLIYRM